MHRAQEVFFGFFLRCHHLALPFAFRVGYWTVTDDFFRRYAAVSGFGHLSEQPYGRSHWLFGACHFAFEDLSWVFVFADFDDLWMGVCSQKIDISISKMADSKWRIEIYEIKRFRSLKTLTRGHLRNGIVGFLTVDSYSQTIKTRKHKFSGWIFECIMVCAGGSVWVLIGLFGWVSRLDMAESLWRGIARDCLVAYFEGEEWCWMVTFERRNRRVSCALYIASGAAGAPFFEHMTSSISESWCDGLILIPNSDSTSGITPETTHSFSTTKPCRPVLLAILGLLLSYIQI